MKWDDSWLRDYRARMAQTAPAPAASVATASMIAFTLPKPTLLHNQLRKLERPVVVGKRVFHGVRYAEYRDKLSAEIAALIPDDPYRKPFRVAAVTVTRFSVGTLPDPGAAEAGIKPMIDILQRRSERHPSGLGIIIGDDPAHLTLDVRCEHVTKRAEQRTLVVIERIDSTESIVTLEPKDQA